MLLTEGHTYSDTPIKTKQNNYKWLDLKPEYKWDKDSPGKFQAALNSDKIKSIINNCRQRIEAGVIESSGELLQTILQEAADLSLVKKEAKSIPTKLKKRPMKSPKKWFDKDCIKLKSLTNKAAISKHKQPWNKGLQDYHKNMLKEFKNTCRAKKNVFWQNEIAKINNVGNEDNFWGKWKQMGEDLTHANAFSNNLDGQRWENHFKNLFTKTGGDINNTMKKSHSPTNETLNEKITIDELKCTIKGLINKKAVGPDEFLKFASDDLLKLILDFLNLNLEKGITSSKWCLDLIALKHKDGPKDDPNNYRGICI